jgi:hypothetical protein
MGGSDRSSFDLSVLAGGRYGTLLWGESRSVLNRVLYAAVRAIDPEPLWLELGAPEPEAEEPGPLELDWIPGDHVFLADEPAAARPQQEVAKVSLLTLVREDESKEMIGRLSNFVRLPPIAQEILSRVRPDGRSRALAIANSDRVRSAYPSTAEGVRPFLSSFQDGGVVPVFTSRGTPGAGRMAFDFVFEVRAPDLGHWRTGALVPEKAPHGTGLAVGRPIPFRSIPELDTVFSAAPGRK